MSVRTDKTHDEDGLRDIVRRCLDDDQQAMIELVDRFRGQVFGLCYRMVGNQQDAEDMAQESFVRMLRSLGRWDSERDFSPWLFAIAGNRCRTLLASRRRRPETTPHVDHLPDERAGDMQAAANLAEEVRLALGGIREEYCQAFRLFHEQQLSYAQIGQIMDCPLGTVKTWVHRARRELIDRLRRRGVVCESGHAVRRI